MMTDPDHEPEVWVVSHNSRKEGGSEDIVELVREAYTRVTYKSIISYLKQGDDPGNPMNTYDLFGIMGTATGIALGQIEVDFERHDEVCNGENCVYHGLEARAFRDLFISNMMQARKERVARWDATKQNASDATERLMQKLKQAGSRKAGE